MTVSVYLCICNCYCYCEEVLILMVLLISWVVFTFDFSQNYISIYIISGSQITLVYVYMINLLVVLSTPSECLPLNRVTLTQICQDPYLTLLIADQRYAP